MSEEQANKIISLLENLNVQPKKYLNADEASKYLGTTKKVLCYELKIPYSKSECGGKRIYDIKDLDEYVKRNKHYPCDINYRKTKLNYVV